VDSNAVTSDVAVKLIGAPADQTAACRQTATREHAALNDVADDNDDGGGGDGGGGGALTSGKIVM
jgi:hypothetical protein